MTKNEFENYFKEKYKSTSSFFCGFTMFAVDTITLVICFFSGFFIENLISIHNINFRSFINYSVFFPFILILFAFFKLYPGIMISQADEIKKFTGATFIAFTMILVLVLFDNITDTMMFERIVKNTKNLQLVFAFLFTFIIASILLTANREMAKLLFSRSRKWGVPAAIFTEGNSSHQIIDNLLSHRNLGYSPCIIIDSSLSLEDETKNPSYKGIPIFSSKNTEILDYLHQINLKTAILCDYKDDITKIMTTYRYTISVSIRQSSFTTSQQIKDIAGVIGFSSTHNLTFKTNLLLKRIFDIFVVLLFSPILLPVFLILCLLTKITSKGPVFYGHKRVGKNGKEFKCWKFRSMNINSQEMLEEILRTDPVRKAEWERERKFSDDPRVTKFGKFLRKTSLDELPQLINILAGQMSFVGPRPVTQEETEMYGDKRDIVLSVTPGLSGMWQISGRSETTYDERIFFDTFYIQNWSIWLDFWIILKTIWVVVGAKGAY